MSRKENTPQSLRIPKAKAPNFPFSSPILEEIPSPTSSSEERDMERNHPFEYLSKSTSRNPFLHESVYGAHAQAKERRKERDANVNDTRRIRGADGSNNNATLRTGPEKPVGLNLVTDFSRAHQGNCHDPAPSFVDLNDLKMLSHEREKERSTQKIRDVLRKGPFQGFRQLPDEPLLAEKGHICLGPRGKSSSNKKGQDEVSPSDRPIVIGYTMPADECSGSHEKPKELDSAGSQPTPSIVVTPAKEDSFWSGSSPDYRRPRSSVYSQPTPQIGHRESDIPPVPAIPALHSVARNENAGLDSQPRQSIFSTRNRSLSTGTVFEEDVAASPRIGRRSRSYSEDNVKSTHRQSATSFVNKHQSQGWWTYLLSPLLSRSSTISSRKTPTSAERPPIPSDPTTATEWWEEKEVSSFSPETPETAVTNRGIGFGDTRSRSRKDSEGKAEQTTRRGVASFMFPGGPVQGAAAEYYQACAHELFSRGPYFECINHVCSITPRDTVDIDVEDGPASDPADGSRGLALLGVDAPNKSKNPFIESSNPRGHFPGSPEVGCGTENPFDTDQGFKPPSESAQSPKRHFPGYGRRESPETEPFYPPEKQAGSPIQQTQATRAPSAPRIHFPLISSPPQASAGSEDEIEPRRMTVFPGSQAKIQSPDTSSPGLQRATERAGSIPMSDIHDSPAPAYGSNDDSYPLPSHPDPYPIPRGVPIADRYGIEAHRRRLEREDELGQQAGGMWRGRGPVRKKGCFGRPGREGRLKRRWYLVIAGFFLLVVVLAVVLATTLTRKEHQTPVQSRWLNLTGYPPMPTGISTIAGPVPRVQNSGCIKPSSLWSCALPEEQQEANMPYAATQPNFRVLIRFRNGTYENSTVPVPSNSTNLRTRELFQPSPPPPSIEDQIFLGNTTDNNSRPFAGEETPFYISVLSPIKLSDSKLARRYLFPNLTAAIPPPEDTPDGTAAPANLYPFPESQPVRLYNRGENDEHYGFYTYFDRSILLESSTPLDGSRKDKNPDDKNGGSTKEEARVRCTWAETRFLVQIWTRPTRSGKILLERNIQPSSTAQSTSSPTATPFPSPSSSTTNSSAKDFTRPGSFPYPITITLDRHGGAKKDKMVYCYGLDDEQRINATEKKLQLEDRGFGGTLVNPAPGIFNNTDEEASALIGRRDESTGAGGVDGGTGGCMCRWVNWVVLA